MSFSPHLFFVSSPRAAPRLAPLAGLGLMTSMAALALLAAGPAHAGPDLLLELKQTWRCPIADRIERLHDAGDPAQDKDRFIVVAMPAQRRGPVGGYVQCRFHDRETTILCEAASGWWETKPGEPRTAHLAPARIAALGRLGFSTDDSHGNFALERPVATPPDFGALADLILDALYVAYDARSSDMLEFTAPFAPGMVFGCDPMG